MEKDHYDPEVMLTKPSRFSRELHVIVDGEEEEEDDGQDDFDCLLAIADDQSGEWE